MSVAEVALLALAAGLGAFAKGVTGFGMPMIAIPLASLLVGVEDAVVAIAVPNVASNVWLAWRNRTAAAEVPPMGAFLAAGIAGAAVGVALFTTLDSVWIARILAAVVVLFLVNKRVNPHFRVDRSRYRLAGPPVGLVSGVLQGSSGISGPVVVMYADALRLGRSAFVYVVTVIFGVLGGAQVVGLVTAGEFDTARTVAAALLFVPTAIGTWLGTRFSELLSGRTFDRLVDALLLASAVALVL